MMIFKELDEVILKENVEDIPAGTKGMIVEVLKDNNYIVDFTQEDQFYNCDESSIRFYNIDGKLLEEN